MRTSAPSRRADKRSVIRQFRSPPPSADPPDKPAEPDDTTESGSCGSTRSFRVTRGSPRASTLLIKEKELTRLRDQVNDERRALPWVKLDKTYEFDTPRGKQTLADLFDGRSQLIVKHFMFGPDWPEGCVGCSFECDHVSGALVHLEHHDVTYVVVSRAPLPKIQAFKRRMGWQFRPGSLRSATTSTTTSTYHSRPSRKPPARCTQLPTTTCVRSKATKCPAGACSTRTRRGMSFILIPHTAAVGKCTSAPTTTLTSRRRVARRRSGAT